MRSSAAGSGIGVAGLGFASFAYPAGCDTMRLRRAAGGGIGVGDFGCTNFLPFAVCPRVCLVTLQYHLPLRYPLCGQREVFLRAGCALASVAARTTNAAAATNTIIFIAFLPCNRPLTRSPRRREQAASSELSDQAP